MNENEILIVLKEIKTLLKGRKIRFLQAEGNLSGVIKADESNKVSIYCITAGGTITINSASITMIAGNSYIYTGDKNDVIDQDITYDANGGNIQLIISYIGNY